MRWRAAPVALADGRDRDSGDRGRGCIRHGPHLVTDLPSGSFRLQPLRQEPAPPVPRFFRAKAEAAARQWASGAGTREVSKLTTSEITLNFLSTWGSGQSTVDLTGRLNPLIGAPGTRDEEWIVAVSGSIPRSVAWEPASLRPGSIPWGVITFDATTREAVSAHTASPASEVTWPLGRDEISDLAG